MEGRVAGERAADGVAHGTAGAVGSDHILGVNGAFLALTFSVGVHERHRDGIFTLVGIRQADEVQAEIRLHARRRVRHHLGEVVQHACLVDDEVRELADARGVIHCPGRTDDACRVCWVRRPEGHLGDPVGLGDDALREAERLEGLDAAGLDAVGLADRQTLAATLHDASRDAGKLGELGGGDHAGRPRSHYQDVDVLRQLVGAIEADPRGILQAGIGGHVSAVMKLHGFLTSLWAVFDNRTRHSIIACWIIYHPAV